MFDIDHFKIFNDIYGHDAGDFALSSIGKFLTNNFREGDLAYRFGGEEFMVVMNVATVESAMDKAEFLRQSINLKKAVGFRKSLYLVVWLEYFEKAALTNLVSANL